MNQSFFLIPIEGKGTSKINSLHFRSRTEGGSLVLAFEFLERSPEGVTIQMKATKQYFYVVLFIMLYPAFESVDEIIKYDHSNESYRASLSCGVVCYAVQGDSNFCVCE